VVFLNGERQQSMKKQVLIDLDGTLLENNMDVFAPAYYKMLSAHLSEHIQPETMIRYLLAGTKAMIQNQDPAKTLEQTFDEIFYPGIEVQKSAIIEDIQAFYRIKFPNLISVTRKIPAAIQLIENVIKAGYRVSIATNPLFPCTAVEQRLIWAGLEPVKYQFEIISSYEHFHYAKPNPEYYREFAAKLNVPVDECVMIGNDYEADIIPSRIAGMRAFHIVDSGLDGGHPKGQPSGTIDEAIAWLESM
jgi:FMN phosphatase YigB (HAD superfamily)